MLNVESLLTEPIAAETAEVQEIKLKQSLIAQYITTKTDMVEVLLGVEETKTGFFQLYQ